jgi:hypothetical protein
VVASGAKRRPPRTSRGEASSGRSAGRACWGPRTPTLPMRRCGTAPPLTRPCYRRQARPISQYRRSHFAASQRRNGRVLWRHLNHTDCRGPARRARLHSRRRAVGCGPERAFAMPRTGQSVPAQKQLTPAVELDETREYARGAGRLSNRHEDAEGGRTIGREWRDRYRPLPSSYDWSRTHARRRGGAALSRLEAGRWPAASVVSATFGSWASARGALERRSSPPA